MTLVRLLALIGFLTAMTGLGGCAVTRFSLPDGQGTPFTEYAPLFDTVVAECRQVRTIEAVIALRGRRGETNLNGRVRAGLAAPGLVRLE